jgi:hypothetical protein
MGEMGKGEMGTAHAGKPPSLPRELRTPLVIMVYFAIKIVGLVEDGLTVLTVSSLGHLVDTVVIITLTS